MLTPATKLFVQLQPDPSGLAKLKELQQGMPLQSPARKVAERALHMTVLHIGVINKTVQAIQDKVALSSPEIISRLDDLTAGLETVTSQPEWQSFQLKPRSYAGFGANNMTYVLTFEATRQLQQLHDASLRKLRVFFKSCGIDDVERFMCQDDNFRYALSLRPHVTLAKSYAGPAGQVDFETMTFTMMPVVYQPD